MKSYTRRSHTYSTYTTSTVTEIPSNNLFNTSEIEWSEDVQDNADVDKESQSEAQLQEELDMMKSLDERLGERDSIMELDVAETIRKSIELREGKNPGVSYFRS